MTNTNGDKVRPDRQTKLVLGGGFLALFAVASFLAVQVWGFNGRLASIETEVSIRLGRVEQEVRDVRAELREIRTDNQKLHSMLMRLLEKENK